MCVDSLCCCVFTGQSVYSKLFHTQGSRNRWMRPEVSCSVGSLYILRSRDPRPPRHLLKTWTSLSIRCLLIIIISLPSGLMCLFWVCVIVREILCFGSVSASRCLVCAVVQASFSPHIWCHVKSARTDGSQQLRNTQQQLTPSSRGPSRLSMFTCTDRRFRLLSKELSAPLANDL